ncbi:hypothetical protein [Victivallis lenta]|uniref:hypothetical protein n=1 Tax=Victivallis lenta TaxID=2606640 RepID=UPI003AB3C98A
MKKLLLFAAALPAAFSMMPAAAETGPFRIQESKGILSVDGLPFRFAHYGRDWWAIHQNDGRALAETGYPKRSPGSFEWRGRMPVRQNQDHFRMTERISAAGTDAVDYSVTLESDADIFTNALGLEAALPLPEFLSRTITIDGKAVGFGPEFDKSKKTQFYFPHAAHTVVLPLTMGTLTITGEFSCNLQDSRQWKNESWQLRIYPTPGTGMIKHSELKLHFRFSPYKSAPLPLQGAANMGFRDEVAEDGRGGWTDQGPDNDLRMFPTGKQTFAGIPFDIADGEKSCIVLRGKERPGFPASAELAAKGKAGRYLYLLHGIAWEAPAGTKIGTVTVESERAEYVDREVLSFDITAGHEVANFWSPRPIDNAVIGWTGKNISAPLGLYLTRLDLGGRPVRSIRFESTGKSVWMIAGATLSDIRIENRKAQGTVVTAGKAYVPMHYRKDIVPGSILDFSGLLDAPAGKYGFLKNAGGNFEFTGRPGIPVRFYGANVCFEAACPPKELADRMADEFAATGWNLIRLHHFDGMLSDRNSNSPLAVNEWVFDNMDYLIAACKKRGIYITIDLFTARALRDGEIAPGQKFTAGEYKALIFIDERARKNFTDFARVLLNRRNKYTGLAWKEDPAIAMISLVNEDTIFHTVDSSGYVRGAYEREFDRYLAEHRLTPAPEIRPQLWRKFLSEIYSRGFAELRAFCEAEGVRAPVTDQNFWGTLSMTLLRNQYDYVDNHFYWKHPVFLGNSWQLPLRVSNESAIGDYAGGVSGMAPTRILGKPFSISEWNYVYPNPYVAEGAFLMGAYGAAQEWDSLCRFAYSHGSGRLKNEESLLGTFDVANDPMRMLSERAGILFFLRGDVQPSKAVYPILLPADHLDRSALDSYPVALQRLVLLGKTGTQITGEAGASLPAGTRAAVNLAGNPPETPFPVYTPDEARKELKLDRTAFTNDTGELTVDTKAGTFLVRTPKSEGFVLPPDKMLAGNFATVRNGGAFAALLIAAMDGRTLAESNRYLLLHLTESHNSGIRFRDQAMTIVEDWGKLPLLLRKTNMEITLNRDFTGYTLHAVDFNGERLFPVEFKVSGGKTSFTAESIMNGRAVAVFELTK